jgi:hypothetical protein
MKERETTPHNMKERETTPNNTKQRGTVTTNAVTKYCAACGPWAKPP